MAANETYERNQLYNISLADLQPDPNQPRKYLDATALDELTASITQHGVLEPILFRQDNGLLYVIAGERRCAAARKAGLATIPAIFIDGQNHDEISLVENLLRSDLTPVEEAEAMDRIIKEHSYKQEDLAQMLGKSRVIVTETLSLNRLPQSVRDECRTDPSVPKRVLIDIARKKQERSMLTAYKNYKASLTSKNNSRTGGNVTKVQSTCNAMDAVEKRIASLDPQSLSSDDKLTFIRFMNVLKNTIEIALKAAKGPTVMAAAQVKKVQKAAPLKKKSSSKKLA